MCPVQLDFQWYVGIDWASRLHRCYCINAQGEKLDTRWIQHNGNGLNDLVAWLRQFCGDHPDQLAVAIEVPHGAIVETLLEHRFAVFSINPKQLDRFRDRYSPAGAKDDTRDAMVLAHSLRTDRPCFRLSCILPAEIARLRELCRLEDSLTQHRQRLENQLYDLARRYYPQLLELNTSPNEPWIWDLWEKAPLPAQGAKLRLATITAILKQHRIRRLDATQVHQILAAPALRLAPGASEASSERALCLLTVVRLLQRQEADVIRRIEAALAQLATPTDKQEHRDAAILLSLPGVGRKIGATVLSLAYQAIAERDYHALRLLGGVAPVTRQSGKKKLIHMRYSCHPELRNAFHQMAMNATLRDPKSEQLYDQRKKDGKKHSRALRGVADRQLNVLSSMLRHRMLYDPQLRQV